jgi:hypothetical protein
MVYTRPQTCSKGGVIKGRVERAKIAKERLGLLRRDASPLLPHQQRVEDLDGPEGGYQGLITAVQAIKNLDRERRLLVRETPG